MSTDYDVAVVGGGPAGCSAAVFTARYGLDTVVFDRGRSSIQRCAYLENYLGFPAGIDVETLYGLMHEHVAEAGCTLVAEFVESVTRREGGEGFVVETQAGECVTARRVVAATRYDGEYLRGLDDEEAMFETYEHDGETHERFDRSYAASDGTTPVGGLYVASPSSEADRQAVVAAGRGARVGLAVVGDARRARGRPASLADHYDWVRQESTLDDEWADRGRWREWYDERRPANHTDDEQWQAMRERDIDRRLGTYLTAEEIEQRTERGHRRLLDHVDDDLVLERAREIRSETVEAGE
ncbi:Pyridine nucleotide-disulphide oxidoreductase [Halogranum gelatinilyticum]|uniref:Pyridine nucleotide-disulphide oxidoreductase n=1 Tax=Halogranum gelatinilyticum TaxID=660521 RepID=A0A1G9X517_9EURY|nr:NAD(P)/FAD-dependent oxidoreductase [Halogranum gelatinilyticum]SDM91443.1 Pyridine nucleotide-disulphide oxidoreductase [Halogranum gelatinilyticum]